ncbi:hypothetical protein CFC21_011045 [Triticum aestivum]|uniref:Uncharacterized protein n=2 Tax=Triticum aestivum TaxID=4565 RepID=A0A9R1DMA8_WHEAT|nr:hypothetical protein CFC21_011045 [Triticum aestivum]
MANRTALAHAATLLSLLLLMCFAIHVHCRIMEDKVSKKIHLPHGLCAHRGWNCRTAFHCDCCLLSNICYTSMDLCMEACK